MNRRLIAAAAVAGLALTGCSAAEEAADKAKDAAVAATSVAGNAADAAGDAAGDAVDAAGDAAGDAADAVGDVASGATSVAGNAVDAAGDAAGDAVDAAGDAAGDAADAVGDAASGATEAVGDAADAVGDAAGNAVDKAKDVFSSDDQVEVDAADGNKIKLPQSVIDKWTKLGGAEGVGIPKGGAADAGEGKVVRLEKGASLYANKSGEAFLVQGKILEKYMSLGEASGKLGLPTTDETPIADGWVSNFENGKIFYYAKGEYKVEEN